MRHDAARLDGHRGVALDGQPLAHDDLRALERGVDVAQTQRPFRAHISRGVGMELWSRWNERRRCDGYRLQRIE